MKIKFYVVTYNRPEELNTTLTSLFQSDITNYNVEFFIVNNYTDISLAPEFKDKVTVLENTFRPDNSTGHLSRNYNEIFLHGIKDIRNPDCDILMHSHDDNLFEKDFGSKMLEYHKQYNFITFSQGCGLCSYLPESIDKIGMWDERFCTIGYHEGDYFIRALIYNKDKTSINDGNQGRLYNPLPPVCTKQPGTGQNEAHQTSFNNYSICRQMWELKWPGRRDGGWTDLPNGPSTHMHMYYPYFEKHLSALPVKYFGEIDAFGQPFLQ
tara:strand:+ start:8266 stop:9066 length:801 start_codon:yes stop_codon:yes gene_type:complete